MSFQQFLEFVDRKSLFAATATRTKWQSVCGSAFASVEPILVNTGQTVRSLPAERAGQARRRVVKREQEWYLVCDEDPNFLRKLTIDEITLYQLEVRELRKRLAAALGLATANSTLQLGALIHIGDWKPRPAARAPVYLVRSRDQVETRKAVQERLITHSTSSIYLLVSESGWDDVLAEEVKRHNSVIAVVSDVVAIEGIGWSADAVWDCVKSELLHRAGAVKQTKLIKPKRVPKHATRSEKVDRLTRAVEAEAMRRFEECEEGERVERVVVLSKPSKQELCKSAGLDTKEFSRVLNDLACANTKRLFGWLRDPEALSRWSVGKRKAPLRRRD